MELTQMVSIRIGDLIIGTIYVSPSPNPSQMIAELDKFASKCRGRVMLARDFNAKNAAWDARRNSRGIALRRWAQHRGWKIAAPSSSSFMSKQASSKIDLYLFEGCKITKSKIWEGQWSGVSGDLTVVSTLTKSRFESARKSPVLRKSRRKREDLQVYAAQSNTRNMQRPIRKRSRNRICEVHEHGCTTIQTPGKTSKIQNDKTILDKRALQHVDWEE